MATSKTERIDREITKTREKITELQRRFRELSALLKSEPIPGIATITQEEKKEDFEDEA